MAVKTVPLIRCPPDAPIEVRTEIYFQWCERYQAVNPDWMLPYGVKKRWFDFRREHPFTSKMVRPRREVVGIIDVDNGTVINGAFYPTWTKPLQTPSEFNPHPPTNISNVKKQPRWKRLVKYYINYYYKKKTKREYNRLIKRLTQ